MDGWNTSFLLGWRIFGCELLVSGRVLLGYFQVWRRLSSRTPALRPCRLRILEFRTTGKNEHWRGMCICYWKSMMAKTWCKKQSKYFRRCFFVVFYVFFAPGWNSKMMPFSWRGTRRTQFFFNAKSWIIVGGQGPNWEASTCVFFFMP